MNMGRYLKAKFSSPDESLGTESLFLRHFVQESQKLNIDT